VVFTEKDMKLRKLLVAIALATAGSAAHSAGIAGLVIPDQYIVVLKSTTLPGPAAVAPVAQNLLGRVGGGELMFVYGNSLNGFAVRVSKLQADLLARNPLVAYVEQDQTFELVATQASPPWGLDRSDQRALPLSGSYTYGGTGAGVKVYDIDTGLRSTHVDFAGRVVPGRNFATNSSGTLCTLLGFGCAAPVPTNTSDCNGHGTHTAGTAVGTTYGVAKGAYIVPVRVFGCGNSTATTTIIAGVDWVTGDHQAGQPAVANMSLGGGASTALDTSVQNLINDGVTVAIAAGNESGADACGVSPARVLAGITVGSTESNDGRSSFSNIGACLDLFAPGGGVVSAGISSDTSSANLSGTSMAAPHVAGAAARYLAANPTASPAAVQAAIVGNATTGVVGNPGAGSPNRLLYVAPTGP
jgi:subtilisin family serine protease